MSDGSIFSTVQSVSNAVTIPIADAISGANSIRGSSSAGQAARSVASSSSSSFSSSSSWGWGWSLFSLAACAAVGILAVKMTGDEEYPIDIDNIAKDREEHRVTSLPGLVLSSGKQVSSEENVSSSGFIALNYYIYK